VCAGLLKFLKLAKGTTCTNRDISIMMQRYLNNPGKEGGPVAPSLVIPDQVMRVCEPTVSVVDSADSFIYIPTLTLTHTLPQQWLVRADAVLAKLTPRTYAKCQAEQKIKKGEKDYSKTVMKSTYSVV
jgi:hypothetical protein